MYKVLIATIAYKEGIDAPPSVSTQVVEFSTPEEAEDAVVNSATCYYSGSSVRMQTRATFLNKP